MNRFFVLLVVMVLAQGCQMTQFAPSRLAQTFPPRTTPESIEVFRSKVPEKKFIEIGAIRDCCGYGVASDLTDIRKKASEVGGDALLDLQIDATGGITGTVIRYQ